MVKKIEGNKTTVYIGNHFEIEILHQIYLPLVMKSTVTETAQAMTGGLGSMSTLTLNPYPGPGEGGETSFQRSEPKQLVKKTPSPLVKTASAAQSSASQQPPSGQTWRSYYFVGTSRVAIRTQDAGGNNEVHYLLSDHLGSTSITVDNEGNKIAELRYKPWGETRYTWGSQMTDYQFTNQRSEKTLGLYFYQSRFFDPSLGRFTQPDPIVPNAWNPKSFDRFGYVVNNPLRYIDPSGHRECEYVTPEGRCVGGSAPPRGYSNCDGFNCYMSGLRYPDIKPIGEWAISQEGIDFIRVWEGLHLRLYNDRCASNDIECLYDTKGNGVGDCTIGYGHVVHYEQCNGDPTEAKFSNGISPEEAEQLFLRDIRNTEKVFKERIEKEGITTLVTQSQYDALISLVYNWGVPNFFNKDKSVNQHAGEKLELLATGDYYGFAQHYLLGPKTGGGGYMEGLEKRRKAEAEMILRVVGP